MTHVSVLTSFPFRQMNSNHVLSHNYDNYSVNTIITATSAVLTVMWEIIESVHHTVMIMI